MAVLISKDEVREPLYAIVPLFNPWRWKSRYKHTARAIKHFADSGAVVVLVELTFNRRELVFADSGLDGTPAECNIHGENKYRHIYLPLHTRDELWLKENSINVAVARALPWDWTQMCWLDADVQFLRPNWVGECIQKLQHYKFLQMFTHARDLNPHYEMLPETYPHANGAGFMSIYRNGGIEGLTKAYGARPGYYYGAKPWPGLAWACTRQAFDEVGGLIDWAVWGGGDWHMAHALVEKRDAMMHTGLHPSYQQLVNAWADRCTRFIRGNVGCMDGSIVHQWHGPKTERGYSAKHRLLAQIGFDPLIHLKRDYQGLWQLNDDGSEAYIQLRDAMRTIARERDEDSTYTGLDTNPSQGH